MTDEKGALVSAANFTFDNVVFHDVRVTDPQVHNECVYAIGVPGMTVRNSHFYACATMDLFFTWGTWWLPAPPGYGNVTLENNVFEHTYEEGRHLALLQPVCGLRRPRRRLFVGWTVRNNTFEIPASLDPAPSGGSRWVGNLGGWSCMAGMRYSHNVGKNCGGPGQERLALGVVRRATAPLGWIDPGAFNFRLKAGSPAINAADPNDHPALDRDGFARDARPDAGAHEFGRRAPRERARHPRRAARRRHPRSAAGRGSGRPASGHGSSASSRAAAARPARGSALRSTKARVSIRLQRLRQARTRHLVRSRTLVVKKRRATRIRARGLARGRYRVVVVATNAEGRRSAARSLTFRVR